MLAPGIGWSYSAVPQTFPEAVDAPARRGSPQATRVYADTPSESVKLAFARVVPGASGAVDAFMKTLKRKRGTAATDVAVPATMLALPSSCTVKDAADLKNVLCGYLDGPDCVLLDVANIERIDTAALQLLCAFVRDRQSRGLAVQWQGSSAALQEATDLLAVRGLLGLAEAPAGDAP